MHSVLARIARKDGSYSGLTHRMNVVYLSDGSKWIADVGFGGDGLIEPIPISVSPTVSFGRTYRIVDGHAAGLTYCLQSLEQNSYIDRFFFHEWPNQQADFEISSFFTSSHPDSVFRKHLMCTIPTMHGRISISDDRLRTVEKGTTRDIFFTPEELPHLLAKHFGIFLDSEETAVISSCEKV